jgi:hypothetical protein
MFDIEIDDFILLLREKNYKVINCFVKIMEMHLDKNSSNNSLQQFINDANLSANDAFELSELMILFSKKIIENENKEIPKMLLYENNDIIFL